MRRLLYCILLLALFAGCKKENDDHQKVEIYLLQSFTLVMNQTTNPATSIISSAVLAPVPLVADDDIAAYKKATTTFILKKDLRSAFQALTPDKFFAVTVDKKAVYYGKIHPGFLSSMVFGMPFIDNILVSQNELPINYFMITGSVNLQHLDKRNDIHLINAMLGSGRLR